jgi:hypothetical protein
MRGVRSVRLAEVDPGLRSRPIDVEDASSGADAGFWRAIGIASRLKVFERPQIGSHQLRFAQSGR